MCCAGLGEGPSVVAEEVVREDGLHVVLRSAVDVKAGDQLLLDYGPEYESFDWASVLADQVKAIGQLGRLRVARSRIGHTADRD